MFNTEKSSALRSFHALQTILTKPANKHKLHPRLSQRSTAVTHALPSHCRSASRKQRLAGQNETLDEKSKDKTSYRTTGQYNSSTEVLEYLQAVYRLHHAPHVGSQGPHHSNAVAECNDSEPMLPMRRRRVRPWQERMPTKQMRGAHGYVWDRGLVDRRLAGQRGRETRARGALGRCTRDAREGALSPEKHYFAQLVVMFKVNPPGRLHGWRRSSGHEQRQQQPHQFHNNNHNKHG